MIHKQRFLIPRMTYGSGVPVIVYRNIENNTRQPTIHTITVPNTSPKILVILCIPTKLRYIFDHDLSS